MPDVMPILPSWDFDETAAFFQRLGFFERGRWNAGYLIVDHPVGIELHFFASKRFKPSKNDHGAFVRFETASEVDGIHADWALVDLGGGELTHPIDTDYGLREFALLDSMRNLLRVGGAL
jgi:hypothetical protein